MYQRHVRMMLFALVLCTGCGPEETGLRIDTTKLALFPGLLSARVSLYPPDVGCTAIEFSGDTKVGTYNQMVSVGGQSVVETELFSIVPGTYALVVWGFDASGRAIAFACLPDVGIEQGRQTALANPLVLGPVRPRS